jgi:hypothetical protein
MSKESKGMATENKKDTKPLTRSEAVMFLDSKLPPGQLDKVLQTANGVEVLMYAEILRLHDRLDSIENQATEMMSPDKMMELASGFLGGGFGG